MNRCPVSRRAPSFWLAVALALTSLSAVAQVETAVLPQPLPALQDLPPDAQRIPPISARAKAGVLRIVNPPDALLDGKPARLSPGSRIRGTNNLMVMSATLVGQDLKVLYTLEPTGLVHEVWIMTMREIIAHTPPKPLPADY
tara:strand:- start:305 stop:730 length:426 start_codon:yes stop_codon:yes gene_type:complete